MSPLVVPRLGRANTAAPLRVALDVRVFGRRGIGRYNEALHHGLRAFSTDVAVETYGGPLRPRIGQSHRLRLPGYVAQEQLEMPARIARGSYDVVHYTANTAPAIRWGTPASVVTVHDVMYLRGPRQLPLSPSLRQTLGRGYRFIAFHSGTRRCDHIIAVSQYTARELAQRFSDLPPVTVVHSGVHPMFSVEISAEETRRTLQRLELVAGEYFLHPGAVDPRKNTDVVIRAYRRYQASGGEKLLAIMGLSSVAATEFAARHVGSAIRFVRLLPFVSNAVAVTLVKCARAVVFVPSEEGFGYPVVEAMAAGTPAIVSSIEAIRELSGGAAIEVQPKAEDELVAAMQALDDGRSALAEATRRRGLDRARYFTTSRMAEGHVAVYRDAAARRRRS